LPAAALPSQSGPTNPSHSHQRAPVVVSEPLGHASIGITLDIYSHVMPGMQDEATEKIDAGLRAALAG